MHSLKTAPEESLRCWQLSLRMNRKSRVIFQAGSTQKKGKRRGKRGKQTQVVCSETSMPSASTSQSTSTSPPKGGPKKAAELMVIEEGDEVPSENEPMLGRVVWAHFRGSLSYHPAMVILGSMVHLATADPTQAFVFWFADQKISAVSRDKLLDFMEHFKTRVSMCHGKQGQHGTMQAIQELQRRVEISGGSILDVDPLQWAHLGFPLVTIDGSSAHDMLRPVPDLCFSDAVTKRLAAIGEEIREKAAAKDRDIPNEFQEESDIAAVWKGTKKIEDVCIGCADSGRKVICQHPMFQGGMCSKCKDCLQETFHAIGEDGAYAYCTICGAGGELFVCDSSKCGRVYCIPCIEELGGADILDKVRKAKEWLCFLCHEFTPDTHGLLKPHSDWQDRLIIFFDMGHTIVVPDLEYFKSKRRIRVLSLFDGISTGKVALQKLGLDIEVYYASETDESATLVSKANHGADIIHLGDVTQITFEKLSELAPIDLLVGGSPCNELSLANPLRKGFDMEGSGVLFFHFYRVLRDLRELNGSTHLFWMFENVASMRTVYRNVISDFLRCQPAVWDAKHFSAQTRARFFWGNIPGLYSTPEVSAHLRQSVDLNSVLHPQFQRRANVQRLRTVTTNPNSLMQGRHQNMLPVSMDGTDDCMWISELEKLFGFPSHYTDVGNLSTGKRRALLGKAWSVQVVTEILRPLTQYFSTGSEVQLTASAQSAVTSVTGCTHSSTSVLACAETKNETSVTVEGGPTSKISKEGTAVSNGDKTSNISSSPIPDSDLQVSGNQVAAVTSGECSTDSMKDSTDEVIIISDDDDEEGTVTVASSSGPPAAGQAVQAEVATATDTNSSKAIADSDSNDGKVADNTCPSIRSREASEAAAGMEEKDDAEGCMDRVSVVMTTDTMPSSHSKETKETVITTKPSDDDLKPVNSKTTNVSSAGYSNIAFEKVDISDEKITSTKMDATSLVHTSDDENPSCSGYTSHASETAQMSDTLCALACTSVPENFTDHLHNKSFEDTACRSSTGISGKSGNHAATSGITAKSASSTCVDSAVDTVSDSVSSISACCQFSDDSQVSTGSAPHASPCDKSCETAADMHVNQGSEAVQETPSDTSEQVASNASHETATSVTKDTASCALLSADNQGHDTSIDFPQDTVIDTNHDVDGDNHDTASDVHDTATCDANHDAVGTVHVVDTADAADSALASCLDNDVHDFQTDDRTVSKVNSDTASDVDSDISFDYVSDISLDDVGDISLDDVSDISLDDVSDILQDDDTAALYDAVFSLESETCHSMASDENDTCHAPDGVAAENETILEPANLGDNLDVTDETASPKISNDKSLGVLVSQIIQSRKNVNTDPIGRKHITSDRSAVMVSTDNVALSGTASCSIDPAVNILSDIIRVSKTQQNTLQAEEETNLTGAVCDAAETKDRQKENNPSTVDRGKIALLQLLLCSESDLSSEVGDDVTHEEVNQKVDTIVNAEDDGCNESGITDIDNTQEYENTDFIIVGQAFTSATDTSKKKIDEPECAGMQPHSSEHQTQEIFSDLTAVVKYVKTEPQTTYTDKTQGLADSDLQNSDAGNGVHTGTTPPDLSNRLENTPDQISLATVPHKQSESTLKRFFIATDSSSQIITRSQSRLLQVEYFAGLDCDVPSDRTLPAQLCMTEHQETDHTFNDNPVLEAREVSSSSATAEENPQKLELNTDARDPAAEQSDDTDFREKNCKTAEKQLAEGVAESSHTVLITKADKKVNRRGRKQYGDSKRRNRRKRNARTRAQQVKIKPDGNQMQLAAGSEYCELEDTTCQEEYEKPEDLNSCDKIENREGVEIFPAAGNDHTDLEGVACEDQLVKHKRVRSLDEADTSIVVTQTLPFSANACFEDDGTVSGDQSQQSKEFHADSQDDATRDEESHVEQESTSDRSRDNEHKSQGGGSDLSLEDSNTKTVTIPFTNATDVNDTLMADVNVEESEKCELRGTVEAGENHQKGRSNFVLVDQNANPTEEAVIQARDDLMAALNLGERGTVPQTRSRMSRNVSRYITRSQLRKMTCGTNVSTSNEVTDDANKTHHVDEDQPSAFKESQQSLDQVASTAKAHMDKQCLSLLDQSTKNKQTDRSEERTETSEEKGPDEVNVCSKRASRQKKRRSLFGKSRKRRRQTLSTAPPTEVSHARKDTKGKQPGKHEESMETSRNQALDVANVQEQAKRQQTRPRPHDHPQKRKRHALSPGFLSSEVLDLGEALATVKISRDYNGSHGNKDVDFESMNQDETDEDLCLTSSFLLEKSPRNADWITADGGDKTVSDRAREAGGKGAATEVTESRFDEKSLPTEDTDRLNRRTEESIVVRTDNEEEDQLFDYETKQHKTTDLRLASQDKGIRNTERIEKAIKDGLKASYSQNSNGSRVPADKTKALRKKRGRNQGSRQGSSASKRTATLKIGKGHRPQENSTNESSANYEETTESGKSPNVSSEREGPDREPAELHAGCVPKRRRLGRQRAAMKYSILQDTASKVVHGEAVASQDESDLKFQTTSVLEEVHKGQLDHDVQDPGCPGHTNPTDTEHGNICTEKSDQADRRSAQGSLFGMNYKNSKADISQCAKHSRKRRRAKTYFPRRKCYRGKKRRPLEASEISGMENNTEMEDLQRNRTSQSGVSNVKPSDNTRSAQNIHPEIVQSGSLSSISSTVHTPAKGCVELRKEDQSNKRHTPNQRSAAQDAAKESSGHKEDGAPGQRDIADTHAEAPETLKSAWTGRLRLRKKQNAEEDTSVLAGKVSAEHVRQQSCLSIEDRPFFSVERIKTNHTPPNSVQQENRDIVTQSTEWEASTADPDKQRLFILAQPPHDSPASSAQEKSPSPLIESHRSNGMGQPFSTKSSHGRGFKRGTFITRENDHLKRIRLVAVSKDDASTTSEAEQL